MAKKNAQELTKERLAEACRKYGLECFLQSDESLHGLFVYLGQLMKWNRVMNLVGKSCWDEALRILIADSAHLLPFITTLQKNNLLSEEPITWDLGAGAGLPGIPLRLVWQDGHYTLVDSREKRTLFLKTVLAAHPFGNTDVVQARVEHFFPTQPQANMIISRAFMPWEQVLGLVSPYVIERGLVVFLALTPAPQAHTVLETNSRWKCVQEEQYSIGKDERYLWAMQLEG